MEAIEKILALMKAETPAEIDFAEKLAHASIEALKFERLHELEREIHQHLYSPSQGVMGQSRMPDMPDGRNEYGDVPFDDRNQEARDPSSHG